MRAKSLPACLCLALIVLGTLGGCLPKSKDWAHPRIADPRKEDKQFETDTEFCKGKVGQQQDGKGQDAAMAECYRRLGWQQKD